MRNMRRSIRILPKNQRSRRGEVLGGTILRCSVISSWCVLGLMDTGGQWVILAALVLFYVLCMKGSE